MVLIFSVVTEYLAQPLKAASLKFWPQSLQNWLRPSSFLERNSAAPVQSKMDIVSLDSIRLEAIQKMEIADRLVELQTLVSKSIPGCRVFLAKGEPEQDTYRVSDVEDLD